eukprot:5933709-Amphidinium_carterae.1
MKRAHEQHQRECKYALQASKRGCALVKASLGDSGKTQVCQPASVLVPACRAHSPRKQVIAIKRFVLRGYLCRLARAQNTSGLVAWGWGSAMINNGSNK